MYNDHGDWPNSSSLLHAKGTTLEKIRQLTHTLQQFSLPLILGVLAGLILANLDEHLYHQIVDYPLLGDSATLFGHKITFHFIINDIFMLFFFGIAAKEITESALPGGALNPIKKAINPLLGTLGGVLGPIIVFFILAGLLYTDSMSAFADALGKSFVPGGSYADSDPAAIFRGWGVPTATDIALAWLVARMVFGNGHPAVNFLLLLAVADDAIGLGIIAVFYPNPSHPVEPIWLLLVAAGMVAAFLLRKQGVKSWVAYIFIGGTLSWVGLLMASLHPALALVPIVPFLPGPRHDTGLFEEPGPKDLNKDGIPDADNVPHEHHGHSPLEQFEHQLKLFVDMGLFFFAFANAGVSFGTINGVTWIILASLVIGKTLGVTTLSLLGEKAGFPLPTGMSKRHLFTAGIIAGLGLTVALFVSGEAYSAAGPFQGPAKMGAVFSAGAALLAFAVGKALKVKGDRGH